MDERDLVKLNNYDFSRANIDNIRRYLETGKEPDTDYKHFYKRKVFKDRFNADTWEFDGNYLIYKPTGMTVIANEDIEQYLNDLYKDPQIGIGKGIQSLYDLVVDNGIIGISKARIKEFLLKQASYQFTAKEKKLVNKPIIARYPNERWSADLIDMASYSGYNGGKKWILTIIDNFSKYVFATPLPNKNQTTTLEGFERIINEQAKGTYPQVLQTDNGKEFDNKLLLDWAKTNKIHIVKSASYQPTSNALVENFNNILRRMIREGYIRTNSLNWVDHLPNYLINRNNTRQSTTKFKPVDIWRRGRQAEAETADMKEASINIQAKAKKALDQNKTGELQVGDKVRVAFSSISSEVRKLIKQGDKKYITVQFTPRIYEIARKIKPRGRDAEFVKLRYMILMEKRS